MLSRRPQNGPSSWLPPRRLGLLVAVLGILPFAFAAPANAGWPGTNGHIAFESDIPSGTCCNGIYTVAPDGSGFTRVFDDPSQDLSISEYSPDGRWLLVNRRNAGALPERGSPIYAVRDNGLTQNDADVVLLDDPAQPGDIGGIHCTQDGRGVYSLDGSRIAFPRFNSVDAGINGVWVMNADGTPQDVGCRGNRRERCPLVIRRNAVELPERWGDPRGQRGRERTAGGEPRCVPAESRRPVDLVTGQRGAADELARRAQESVLALLLRRHRFCRAGERRECRRLERPADHQPGGLPRALLRHRRR